MIIIARNNTLQKLKESLMKHNQAPATHNNAHEPSTKKGILGRIAAKAALSLDAGAEFMVGKFPGSLEHIQKVTSLLDASSNKRNKLRDGGKVKTNLSETPIAEVRSATGELRRLNSLIFAGESVFGVISNASKQSDGTHRMETVQLVELPFGKK